MCSSNFGIHNCGISSDVQLSDHILTINSFSQVAKWNISIVREWNLFAGNGKLVAHIPLHVAMNEWCVNVDWDASDDTIAERMAEAEHLITDWYANAQQQYTNTLLAHGKSTLEETERHRIYALHHPDDISGSQWGKRVVDILPFPVRPVTKLHRRPEPPSCSLAHYEPLSISPSPRFEVYLDEYNDTLLECMSSQERVEWLWEHGVSAAQ